MSCFVVLNENNVIVKNLNQEGGFGISAIYIYEYYNKVLGKNMNYFV